MRNSFFIILTTATLLCWSFSCIGQQEKKKSSSGERYRAYKDKTEDAADLLNEARSLKSANPTAALNKVEEALGVAIANGDLEAEAQCYILLGEINEGISEWKLALQNFSSAYEILKSSGLMGGKVITDDGANAARGIGNANLKLGNYADALTYFNLAYELSTTSLARAERQIDLSEVYYQMADYPKAIDVLDKIRQRKIADKSLELKIQNQRTKIYAQTNQVNKALDNYQSAQNAVRSAPSAAAKQDEDLLNSTKEEVASSLHAQQKYDDEISLRSSAVEYNLKADNLPEVAVDKIGLGKAFAAKGETNAAIREFEEAVKIADTLDNPHDKAQAFLALATIYDRKNSTEQALSAYRHYSDAVKEYDAQMETRLAERESLLKKQRDIEELSKEVSVGRREEFLAKETVFNQQIIIYGLLLIIAIVLVTSYFIFKNAQASKTANQLLALKSLRSQMNPHFIFNSLNSIQQYVHNYQRETAESFLSEFSILMRKILDNSSKSSILVCDELSIIELYLKLEKARFGARLNYEINVDKSLDIENILIPTMLIQPYIENAIIHGLAPSEGGGKITICLKKAADLVICIVEDNGVGREKALELKSRKIIKNKSYGMSITQARLGILNQHLNCHVSVKIIDLFNEQNKACGTQVEIYILVNEQF